MRSVIRFAAALTLAAQAVVVSAQMSPAPTIVTLAPGQVSQNYIATVDSTTQALTISISNASGGDLDLFVRYGTPFPEQSPSVSYATVDANTINHYAQYHALSGDSNETITILSSSRFPLKAGNWYVVVANDGPLSSGTGTGTLSATTSTAPPVGSITFDFNNPSTDASDPTNDCDDSFWNDTTAATPVGGNQGTTLGQQRKNALNYAGQQLVQQLNIQVSLQVNACGAHLGGDKDSAVVAHAGPTTFLFDDPEFPANYFPKKYTWYPSTLAVKLGGASLCALAGGSCSGSNNEVIQAVFNEDIGTSAVIGGRSFYYGYTPDTSGDDDIDFINIAMHEMTHGLGFIGLVNTDPTAGPVGSKGGLSNSQPGVIAYDDLSEGPWDDIYDDYVAIVNSATYTPFLGYEVNGAHDANRAAAMVSGPVVSSAGQYTPGTQTGIRWSDAVAAASSVNINAGKSAPDDFPSLYAPCDETKTTTCATQPSSTLSHTIQPGDMMNAFYSAANLRSMGLAAPMLSPLGWSTAVQTAPSFAIPVDGNWFDQLHSGHGFDLQLFGHDPVNGDVYALTFYTYDSSGKPEWYQGSGHLADGMFLPSLDPNGNTLTRLTYQTTANAITGLTINDVPGSVIVDFNQADQSPACRNLDRTGALQLAVMYWQIEGDQGSWCVQPIVPTSAHGSPDYNGMWFAASDSGWGFELLDVAASGGASINVVMYLPGPSNNPSWLIGSGTLQGNTVTIALSQTANGYCRTCTPPSSLQQTNVGTMTMTFSSQTTGTATIAVSYPGGGGFNRTNIPISMLSTPTGQ